MGILVRVIWTLIEKVSTSPYFGINTKNNRPFTVRRELLSRGQSDQHEYLYNYQLVQTHPNFTSEKICLTIIVLYPSHVFSESKVFVLNFITAILEFVKVVSDN